MRAKKFVFVSLIIPFLMSNSAGPYAYPVVYEDVEIKCTYKGTYSGKNQYSLCINNYGDYHMMIYGSLPYKIEDKNGYIDCSLLDLLFVNAAFAPKYEREFLFETSEKLDSIGFAKFRSLALTTVADEVKVSNPTLSKIDDKENTYSFNADFENVGDYYYTAIIDVEYKSITYSFKLYLQENWVVETKEELDLEQLSIKNVTIYKKKQTYSGCACHFPKK